MIKEAFITILIFIVLFIFFFIAKKKANSIFKYSVTLALLVCLLLNMVFTLKNYFPSFILDETTPLGDITDNLLLYKEDSEYRSQIIFPIIKDRKVFFDESPDTYALFFKTFSSETQSVCFSSVSKEIIQQTTSDFCKDDVFYLASLLDYVIDDTKLDSFEPSLFYNIDSLSNENSVVAICMDNNDLYVMGKTYYEALTGETVYE